ncbi:histidinol-phosphate transaminase [Quadrisphaera sp. DSM 44207]|uniref:histidinol-phosphate transaminase n=1 Tax=Quadrisphaera sp. DSM 44207 TaxID=1881057 RepID=UPI000883149D|nr:histidinol-phosphate transaminase [Quadrisphaera sp. DSM 44207]SDQ88913.1 histidinol-phosphate aminotransferase [Quadrisphaera sp. DSM 44207]
MAARPTAAPPSTSPRLREALAALPGYRPGRPAPTGPDGASYKISSNENPYPPLPAVLEVVQAAAAQLNRYPDLTSADLVDALARALDVPREHVVVGPGSVAVLGQVLQAVCGPGDEVVHAWRSFEAYPIVVALSGGTAVGVPLGAGGRHDLRAMADAVTERTRLVIVCSPNNPTGPAVGADELEELLDRVPDDVLVLLDEAYAEFVRDPAAADGLRAYRHRPNLAVLRTFSKAYGLAGLRVGYAVAHPPVAEALRKTAVPFGVSSIASLAAVASLAVREELMARVAALVAERERVAGALAAQGWALPRSEANFLWLPLGEGAEAFAAACEAAGLSVRPFPGEGVRATVAEPQAGDRLLGVAARWRAEHAS